MAEPMLPERERLLAETVARLRAEVYELHAAAWDRSVIDTATGLLAGRLGCGIQEASARLAADAARAGHDRLTAAAVVLDLDTAPRTDPRDATPTPAHLGAYHRSIAACGMARSADEVADHLGAAMAAVCHPGAVVLAVSRPEEDLAVLGAHRVPPHVLHRVERFRHPRTPPVVVATTGDRLWFPDATTKAEGYLPLEHPETRWHTQAWIPVRGDQHHDQHHDDQRTAVVGLLWEDSFDPNPRARYLLEFAATVAGRRILTPPLRHSPRPDPEGEASARVQTILDVLAGSTALLIPIHDATGTLIDWRISAISPNAVDVAGRRGARLIGRRIAEVYPTIAGTELWAAYQHTYETGVPSRVGPFEYTEVIAQAPRVSRYSFRVNRLPPGIVVGWIRHDLSDRLAARIATTERLGRLGWAVWHLNRHASTEWSDQMYTIFDRDPVDGPLEYDEMTALIHPDDADRVRDAVDALLYRRARFDVEFRVRLRSGIRHLHGVVEAVHDANGTPLEIHGLLQDVTGVRLSHERLISTRRELIANQQRLAEGHRLTVSLQRIILPVPRKPLTLPGMRIAVRYLPAGHTARVGGDWYHALALPDGAALLAIGDVAGHGLPAASVMAQLRHAMTGLAAVSPWPPGILAALNAVLCDHVPEQTLATAVVARYEPWTRRLTWSQAGHLPCLLARGDTVERLARPDGLVLGAWRDATYAVAHTTLEPDDLLLMFTDGLVEGSRTTVDQAIDEVAVTVAATRTSGGDVTAAVRAAVRHANPDDDTCVLAAQPTP